jgi:hypothetical protein
VQGTEVKDRGLVPAEPVAKFMAATETTSGALRGLSGMAHAHMPNRVRCISGYICAAPRTHSWVRSSGHR